TSVCVLVSEKNGASGEPGIQLPAITAASVARAPISDASTTRPLRILYMYSPTNSAIGMVQAMVNVPQLLPGTTCTLPGGRATTVPGHGTSRAAVSGSCTSNASGRSAGLLSLVYCTLHPAGKVYSGCLRASSSWPGGRVTRMSAPSLTSSPPSALTTTKPSPARAMTTMNRIAADTTP